MSSATSCQGLNPSATSCQLCNMAKLLNFSGPWFPHQQNKDNNTTQLIELIQGLRDWIFRKHLEMSIPCARHSPNPFTCIFSLDFSQQPIEEEVMLPICYPMPQTWESMHTGIRKGREIPRHIHQKAGLQNSVWSHLSPWNTCLDTYQRTFSFNNPFNTKAICKAQWRMKKQTPVLQIIKNSKVMTEEHQTKHAWGLLSRVPCDCTGHTPMKHALPLGFCLVGFHCLNCFFLPAWPLCPELNEPVQRGTQASVASRSCPGPPPGCEESQASCFRLAGTGLMPWAGKFPLGKVGGSPRILHSF